MSKHIMGIDQYGQTYHDLGPHPRKALLELFGRKRAEKIYVDTKTETKHVGYVVAGLWVRLYEVSEWKTSAGPA